MKQIISIALVLLSLFVGSCKKTEMVTPQITEVTNDTIGQKVAPDDFNYNTTAAANFKLAIKGPNGEPINGIPVQVNIILNDTLIPLFNIITDNNGIAEGTYNLPAYVKEVVISPNYIGVLNNIIVPKIGNEISMSIIGTQFSEGKTFSTFNRSSNYQASQNKTSTILHYKYLSPFNSLGVPTIKETPDVITKQMLDFVNNSLPERKPVTIYHPSFLQNGINTDLDITEEADVWITFVHEGAGYTNSLCYYTYQTSNPPTSISQIDSFYVVFPNASYLNSGGGLNSGDKVKIGRFQAGTSIGFLCVSNGWNGSGVGDGYSRLLSDKNLNNSANPLNKQQTVMLYDDVNKQYYLGFEDIQRDNASCDNDFNDMIIYAKSNPVTAISNKNVPLADNGLDSDGDGVSDVYDEFPTNSSLAYKNYLPAPGSYGTLAYEDLWPAQGDFDFNDLVLGYQFEQWTNAQNKVKEMKGRFVIRAIGAHYSHGFGFQMNVPSNSVESVSGMKMYDNLVSLSSNNTEAGQSLTTIIPFDNDYKVVKRTKGNAMNTSITSTYQVPDTSSVHISFTTPKSQTELGTYPYNPFIFVNGDRGKEVHLAGNANTTKANAAYFGQSQDNTNIARKNYYKTKLNMPYAVHLPETFAYPLEKESIIQSYLKFSAWSQSGGTNYSDWFKNLVGYRNETKIYPR